MRVWDIHPKHYEALAKEFSARGYSHHTPLEKKLATGEGSQKVFINTLKEQKVILKNKPCDCLLHV